MIAREPWLVQVSIGLRPNLAFWPQQRLWGESLEPGILGDGSRVMGLVDEGTRVTYHRLLAQQPSPSNNLLHSNPRPGRQKWHASNNYEKWVRRLGRRCSLTFLKRITTLHKLHDRKGLHLIQRLLPLMGIGKTFLGLGYSQEGLEKG